MRSHLRAACRPRHVFLSRNSRISTYLRNRPDHRGLRPETVSKLCGHANTTATERAQPLDDPVRVDGGDRLNQGLGSSLDQYGLTG